MVTTFEARRTEFNEKLQARRRRLAYFIGHSTVDVHSLQSLQHQLSGCHELLASGLLVTGIGHASLQVEQDEIIDNLVVQLKSGNAAGKKLCVASLVDTMPYGLREYVTCFNEPIEGEACSFAELPPECLIDVVRVAKVGPQSLGFVVAGCRPDQPVAIDLHDVDMAFAPGMPSFY